MSNGLPPEPSDGGDYEPRPAGLDRAIELELIDAALLNDIQAFSELFEHYRSALYGLCCRRLNDPSLAEDVVQEAFLKAFKNLSSYDRGKPVWPWLSTIAHRMCVDLQRHRSLTQYFADLGVAVDEDAEVRGHTGSALDEVMASEDNAELWKSLEALPKRQRRALLLYAQDGMSYADIAAAEGISIGAVKLLIVRARRKMRTERQNGTFGVVVFPFTWLGWKFQRIEERIRPLLSVYGEGLSSICASAACLGALAMVAVVTGFPNEPFNGNSALTSDETILLSTQSPSLQTASLPTALSNIGAPAKPPVEPQQSTEDPESFLLDDVNPNENATPENSTLYSFTVSPNYDSDHTILASGYSGPFRVLFMSRDGGANWKPLPSRLLNGWTIALTPGYPQDKRIFAIGDYGLQQSDDGGEIFRTVSPLGVHHLAISPSFGRGDSRILMGGTRIFEYDAETGVTQPALLNLPLSNGTSYVPTFSPGYPSDPTIFVSKNTDPPLYRCKGSVCDVVWLPPTDWRVTLRLSPRFDQDGVAYAFAGKELFISNDGARTFREFQFPLSDENFISDVVILPNTSSEPVIFVVSDGVYRSLDGGQSWSSLGIDVPGIKDYGANQLIVTPTGRLLVTGKYGGIACSETKGQTWARRCTPEPKGM